MKRFLSMIAALLVSSLAFASVGSQTAQITYLRGGQSLNGDLGAVLVGFTNANTTPNACVTTGNTKFFAIDPTTAQGRAALELATLAFTTGRSVTIEGAAQCTVYTGVEDLGYIYFNY